MHKFFGRAALAVVMVFGSFSVSQADVTEAEVRGMMRAFLLENGAVVAESLQRFQRQEALRRAMGVVRATTPLMGDVDSPVTVIEFSDYECPYCRSVQPAINKLKERYGSRVRFAFKHVPLSFHAKAPAAAKAAIAAQEQGKFWEFSDALFMQQALLGEKLYESIAKDLKLDMKKFNAYRNSDAAEERLAQDMIDGQAVGVRGTPFFLVNGRPLSGAQPLSEFVDAVEAALRETEKETKKEKEEVKNNGAKQ